MYIYIYIYFFFFFKETEIKWLENCINVRNQQVKGKKRSQHMLVRARPPCVTDARMYRDAPMTTSHGFKQRRNPGSKFPQR